MVLEATSSLAGGQIPQTQGLVPRAGQSVVAVGRQHNVTDEMAVTVQTLLGNAVVGLVTGQLPHDQGLVCLCCQCKILDNVDITTKKQQICKTVEWI